MEKRVLAVLALVAAATACSKGGGSGGGSLGSTAPITSPSGAPPSSGAVVITQKGFSGVWTITGTDPLRGAFTGTAEVAANASGGYTVKRLVTYQTKLASGEEVLAAWTASAREEQGGLRVDASLRRAHVFKRAGNQTRTLADQPPLALSALLVAASGPLQGVGVGTAIQGTFNAVSGVGPTETWTFSTAAAPPFPVTNLTLIDAHPAPKASVKATLFATYAGYHTLPAIAPYVSRPEFQAAIHKTMLDTTAHDWYRQRGPGAVVLVDKVADDVAVAEESQRAHAFSRRLVEKAQLFDADLKNVNADQNGMVTSVDLSVSPPLHDFAQSPVLYTGDWALSQLYRYRATGDPEAMDNLVRGVTGAVICVDICPTKSEFARAIDLLAHAQPGTVGTGTKYSWQPGTGQYANLMWMVGGNNDMLHGIESCFVAGALALPASHPLRAQVGAQAESLVNNVKDAQSGTHEIFLSYAASATTGDPAWQARYTKALGFKNILDKLYTQQGGMLIQEQGTADWSGHGLGTLTLLDLSLLGGASPTPDEQSWRDAATQGIQAGFAMCGLYREGMVVMIAAAARCPGALDLAKGVLDEIPYPKAYGDCDVDYTIAGDYCMSPYPSDPWKLDWMTNDRTQSLVSYPYFYRGSEVNFWNRGPLDYRHGPDKDQEPGQDFLLSYWYARSNALLGPND